MKNDAGEMSVSKDPKAEGLVRSTTDGFSMLSLTGTQTTCLMNHQRKAYLSQSPVTWF